MSVGKTLAVILGSAPVLGAGQLSAAPTASMLGDTCAGCHGTDGVSMGPATPNIAGLSETYFTDTMLAFKSGDKPGTVMGPDRQGLFRRGNQAHGRLTSPVSRWPAPVKNWMPPRWPPARNSTRRIAQNVMMKTAALADDDAGILASQWLPYLTYAMEDFKAGTREMPKKMKKKVDELSDAELEGLLQFFASQQ